MIKILYIIACLKTGGSEKYLLNMIKNLDKDRYQVTVWCEGAWGPTGDEIRKAGAAVVQRPLRPGRPDQLLGGIRYIRKNKFDIVHSLKYNTNFMDALVSKGSRVKVFMTSRRNLPFWIKADKVRNPERIRNALTDRVISELGGSERTDDRGREGPGKEDIRDLHRDRPDRGRCGDQETKSPPIPPPSGYQKALWSSVPLEIYAKQKVIHT